MNGPAVISCDHHYEAQILGGHPLTVRVCLFCHTPDWNDLASQADVLYRWGREEALAGRPPRAHLSAYDKPRDDEPADRDLRDRIRRAICEASGFAWDPDMQELDEYGEHADAVLAVLPADTGRAAVLREAADAVWAMDYEADGKDYGFDSIKDAWDGGTMDASKYLRRMADEAQQVCVHPQGYEGGCPCPPSCTCCAVTSPDAVRQAGEVDR